MRPDSLGHGSYNWVLKGRHKIVSNSYTRYTQYTLCQSVDTNTPESWQSHLSPLTFRPNFATHGARDFNDSVW